VFATYRLGQLGASTPKSMHPCICRRGYPTKFWSTTGLWRIASWKTDKVDGRFLVSILVRAGHCGVDASARSVCHGNKQLFPYLAKLGKIMTFGEGRKIRQSSTNIKKWWVGRIKICLRTPNDLIASSFHPHSAVLQTFHPTVVFDGPRRKEGHQDDHARGSSGFAVHWSEFLIT
jgi:hypothetical protein